MNGLAADLRLALRVLAKHRALALSVVITLSLAIGAGVSTFAIAEAALITPPPFPEPHRIAMLFTTYTARSRSPERYRWSYPRFRMLERSLTTTSAVGSYGLASVNLAGTTDAEPMNAEIVGGGYFDVVGARAARGRLFSAIEDQSPAADPVALVGHALWVRRYGSDPTLIGKTIRVNGREVTVIGTMPPGFRGLTGRGELWFPATLAPRLTYPEYLKTNQNFISVVARLAPNASIASLQAEIAKLRDLIQTVGLGPSTGGIVKAAVARGIPYRRLNKDSMVQFGYGCKQRRIVAAETDYAGRSLKGQLTQARRLGAARTVVVGADDASLRVPGREDETLAHADLVSRLTP